MWSSSWHSASKKSVIYLFNFQYCGIYVGEKKKPDTVVALHSLFSRGTGFSWLPSFLQTAALTGAKNKKERGQTPLIVCYFQSYGDIMWATFCISSLIHLNEKALRVFDAVPWFEVNKAFGATLLHKKRLKMQSPKGVTQMSTSYVPSVKIPIPWALCSRGHGRGMWDSH